MKPLKLFLTTILFFVLGFAHAQKDYNPWAKYGYTPPKPLTLSNGKYDEFFDEDTVVQIGSVYFNTITNQVAGFVVKDTIYSEATLEPYVISRWLSPDPLARKYPSLSPYHFGANSPILTIDPDGQDNTIYIVNLKNKEGEPAIKKENLQSIIDNTKSQLATVSGNKNFNVVIYDQKKYGENISLNKIAKTDGIVLVGNPSDVNSYAKKNNLGSNSNLETWKGGNDHPGTTDVETPVSAVDVNVLLKEGSRLSYKSFVLSHEIGHIAGTSGEHFDRRDENTKLIIPNLNMSGTQMGWLAIQNGMNGKDIPQVAVEAKNQFNTNVKNKLNSYFKSENAKENYGNVSK